MYVYRHVDRKWTVRGKRGVDRVEGRETEYNDSKDNKSNHIYDGKNLMIDKISFCCLCVCDKDGHWMYLKANVGGYNHIAPYPGGRQAGTEVTSLTSMPQELPSAHPEGEPGRAPR